jgi:hypothetical protein
MINLDLKPTHFLAHCALAMLTQYRRDGYSRQDYPYNVTAARRSSSAHRSHHLGVLREPTCTSDYGAACRIDQAVG